MKPYTQDELTEITGTLKAIGADQPCSRCRKSEFTILSMPPDSDYTIFRVACNNCGAITEHLVDILVPHLRSITPMCGKIIQGAGQ